MLKVIIFLLVFGQILFYPILVLLLSILNLIIVVVKNLLSAYFTKTEPLDKLKIKEREKTEDLISVYLAIYNEPATLVNNTLLALSKLDYQNYEVLVLDNNTVEESVWRPVEKFCKNLGSKFKFYHVDKLDGFKAGALNWLMDKTDSKTKFVAIIDADYGVTPDFLSTAIKYFVDERTAFVQLPQAYNNINEQNKGLALEYEYFFATYMAAAQKFQCVSATGTLGIFKMEILKKLGGFNTETITEDAELGTRIALAGYHGVYVPKIMGKGLMPHSLRDLKIQRERWAIGNAQVLRKHFFRLITSRSLNWKQKVVILSQLTAWSNFTFPAGVVMVVFAIFKIMAITEPVWDIAFGVCFITILTFIFLKAVSFFRIFYKKHSFFVIIRAFLVHMGMNYIYSVRYFSGLFSFNFNFARTNKFLTKKISNIFSIVFKEFFTAFIAVTLSIFLLLTQEYFYAVALLTIAFSQLFIYFTFKEVSATKCASEQVFAKIENKENNGSYYHDIYR